MLNDAAAADRAAFLKREARQSWADRLAAVAADVLAARSRRGNARLARARLSVVRVRAADGLSYLVIRGGAR